MSDTPKKSISTRSGWLIALAIAAGMLLCVGEPTSAQFFNFGGYQQQPQRGGGWFGGGWFGNNIFEPFQQRAPRPRLDRRQTRSPVHEDFSKAPSPEKRETAPEHKVLVLGDGMADWLAYGLESAYAEQPEMGVIRKVKSTSGLIQYQPKGPAADWAAVARDILTGEKPAVVVVMLGLNDRIPLHEPAAEKSDKDNSDKQADKKSDKNTHEPKAKSAKDGETKPDDTAAADSELPQNDAPTADTPPAPEKTARSPNRLYQFGDDRWIELYNKKIEEMIGVLKSKGVPVVWVGLPAVHGPKGTSDTLFLDSLYRDATDKAGITYVDVWDGFVDEAGRFLQKGPDFEGQIRQLRTYDGVYFTKAGARKLAHYVEREITRLLAARSALITLPTEPATPDANAVPGQPARPLAGPILPLVASSVGTDQLLGGPGSRPAAVDALAARTLVKGEALAPPAGRADDFAWPRREAGIEQAKGDAPLPASPPADNATAPAAAVTPPAPAQTPLKPRRPLALPLPQQPARNQSPFQDFFGFGGAPPRQMAPPRPPAATGVPRPPGAVGRSAAFQNDWFR